MTPKTARPAAKAKPGGKAKRTTPKTVDRDNGLHRVYARLAETDKKALDALAAKDERSTMKYLERLILKHLEQTRSREKAK